MKAFLKRMHKRAEKVLKVREYYSEHLQEFIDKHTEEKYKDIFEKFFKEELPDIIEVFYADRGKNSIKIKVGLNLELGEVFLSSEDSHSFNAMAEIDYFYLHLANPELYSMIQGIEDKQGSTDLPLKPRCEPSKEAVENSVNYIITRLQELGFEVIGDTSPFKITERQYNKFVGHYVTAEFEGSQRELTLKF